MNALSQQQAEFMDQLLDEEAPLPRSWNRRQAAGLAVYRNNYRTALVDALRSTFEQTERWTGEESFKRAAAHHLITNPPSSWTLDEAGAGFDATCADLFQANPEVAELAWLEWAMHRAFVAADIEPLTHRQFATRSAEFAEEDWLALRFELVPGLQFRATTQNVAGLWRAVREDDSPPKVLALSQAEGIAVWREEDKPVFQSIDREELACLELVSRGASYGNCCEALVDKLGEEKAIPYAGAMLGRWLANGWIVDLRT